MSVTMCCMWSAGRAVVRLLPSHEQAEVRCSDLQEPAVKGGAAEAKDGSQQAGGRSGGRSGDERGTGRGGREEGGREDREGNGNGASGGRGRKDEDEKRRGDSKSDRRERDKGRSRERDRSPVGKSAKKSRHRSPSSSSSSGEDSDGGGVRPQDVWLRPYIKVGGGQGQVGSTSLYMCGLAHWQGCSMCASAAAVAWGAVEGCRLCCVCQRIPVSGSAVVCCTREWTLPSQHSDVSGCQSAESEVMCVLCILSACCALAWVGVRVDYTRKTRESPLPTEWLCHVS